MIISIDTEKRLHDRKDSERHVIFLDIDGVLQPCCSQKRFEHDLEQTKIMVAEEMKEKGYLELDKYDVGAVYYDWHEAAVKNLHDLLWRCDAEIVISSDWKRSKTIEQLKLLLRIHKLDRYVTDMVSYTDHTFKPDEIRNYLREHPELRSYVILDDLDMEKDFRGHTVYTGNESFLTKESMWKAARILKFGPWWEETYIKKTSADYINGRDLIEDYYKKVIFLDIDGVLNDDGVNRDKNGVIIDPRFVSNLSKIIEETGAEVILSSSWRYGYGRYAYEGFAGKDSDMEALLENFDRYKIRVPGSTPRYFNGPDGRPFEIRSWLCHRPDIENFVILDDETFWKWNWLEPHVVCTATEKTRHDGTWHYIKGLDEECTEKAIKILGKRK